jgi:hypothetical protein
MPYIEPANREELESGLFRPDDVGELTFMLTKQLCNYLEDGDNSFSRYADCVAALECAKLEFYRRGIVPFENIKCKLNGDVYK